MRTIGFRSHALLTIAAAVGMIAALTEPWYALAPKPPQADNAIGTIEGPLAAPPALSIKKSL